MLDPRPACANCDATLAGSFCHACGQEDRDLDVPFRELAADWLGNVLAFDARVWTTLGKLFKRPGFLTVEYFAGRRVRYVPPLRLYFFVSLVFFITVAWSDYSFFEINVKEDGDTATAKSTDPAEPTACSPSPCSPPSS